MALPPSSADLSTLDARAREIFREIVEAYLTTGEPVGSRTLSRLGGVALSPASIRNTMADLAALGLLDAPHAMAGRRPTQIGLALLRRQPAAARRRAGRREARDRRAHRAAPAPIRRTCWARRPNCSPASPAARGSS